MHEREQSDPAIGAGKPTNKAEARSVADAAEPVEQRAGAKGNASGQSTLRTQSRERVSQALERVRKAARLRRHHPRREPYALIGPVRGRGVTCVPTAIRADESAVRDPLQTSVVRCHNHADNAVSLASSVLSKRVSRRGTHHSHETNARTRLSPSSGGEAGMRPLAP